MASEAQVRCSLQIVKGKIDYQSKPTVFVADVSGTMGPCPGAFTASVAGTDTDLSALGTPGLCKIQNIDSTNYVTYGIWDPEGATFYPLGELLAGEVFVLRLARDVEEQYGTGTGTSGANTNRLRFKADTAAVKVVVEAFDK